MFRSRDLIFPISIVHSWNRPHGQQNRKPEMGTKTQKFILALSAFRTHESVILHEMSPFITSEPFEPHLSTGTSKGIPHGRPREHTREPINTALTPLTLSLID